MTAFKPLILSAAVVVALTSFASAATRHHAAPANSGYGVEYQTDNANTRAAEHFQDQFKNTY